MDAMKGQKWLVVVIIVVALLSAVLLVAKSDGFSPSAGGGERVVVIYLQGSIGEGSGGYSFAQGITPRYVEQQLKRASEDSTIKAVVLRVNSPGGSVAASQQIAGYVKEFSKPLVISMGDMAASGGYYISSPARGIVAQPGTLTGSIGVISTVMDPEGLYEKLGIKTEVIKSGRHKDMLSRQLTPEERELMQTLSDEIYEQFISDVSAGRNLDKEKVRDLATGQVYTGSQALELGLVDRLGGIEEAVEWAGEMAGIESPKKYEFPAPSFWEQISGLGLKVAALVDKLATPPEIQILNYLQQSFNPGPKLVVE
ncbi:MAG TPA: signal peptide peptidase SppA [Firmicutes bacterium]|nr:signal peptide peptidase SppA [Bacillota bacterium]